jgi:hypothetical protein
VLSVRCINPVLQSDMFEGKTASELGNSLGTTEAVMTYIQKRLALITAVDLTGFSPNNSTTHWTASRFVSALGESSADLVHVSIMCRPWLRTCPSRAARATATMPLCPICRLRRCPWPRDCPGPSLHTRVYSVDL